MQGTGQSTRDKMYVKWFDTVMLYYVTLFLKSSNFPPVPAPVCRSQGPEPGRRMPASAGRDGRGRIAR
ncbi:unnamed protein product, partial [Staurois parvus]